MSTSTLLTTGEDAPVGEADPAPLFPTETEIYLLPDGQVVVADLPAELARALARLGSVEPCDAAPAPHPPLP